MYIYRLLLSFIVLASACCINAQTQSLSKLYEQCYSSIERNDTAAFNNLHVNIFEAYIQDDNPELYSIKNELAEMGNKDQSIRILLLDSQKRFGKKDYRTLNIRKIMNRVDSINSVRVIQIIDKYGWLSSDEIGEDANQAIFLCIQHCTDSVIQQKALPILEQAVRNGAAQGWQFAFLTDRCLMNQGLCQIYGTQTITSGDRTFTVPLQDAEKVDSLRKDVGLEPLSEYMKEFDEEWTKEKYYQELLLSKKAFERWYRNKTGL